MPPDGKDWVLTSKVRPVKVLTFVEAAAELAPAAAATVPKLPRAVEGAREGSQLVTNATPHRAVQPPAV